MRITARLTLLPILVGSFAALARGQNLLANPNFKSSIPPWTTAQPFETVVWKNIDADGSPSSGAADLTNTFPQDGTQGGGSIEQCVPVTGGSFYDFGAMAHIPLQTNTGYAQVQVAWYSGANCGGSFISLAFTSRFTQFNAWGPVTQSAALAPAGAVSATVNLAHFKNEAGGEFVTHFDNAYLTPAAAPSGLVTLPSITSIHGANDTFFHSDVWILNRSFTNSQNLSFHYRCLAGLTCVSAPTSVTLGPRESRLFSDIVVSFFASPESAGALEIGYNSALGGLTANSRLYTPNLPSPTSGFSLPAQPPDEARTRAVFIGLGGSGGDLSTGFRTNAGAYNPNASSVIVTFTLHAASGAVLGSPLSRTYAPFEPAQLNDIFAKVGAGSTVATDAYLVVSTNGLPVFPYVAVIDNKSGDSVWVIPSDDEGP